MSVLLKNTAAKGGENSVPLLQGRSNMLNLSEGGQQGAMTLNHQWTSAAAYVKQKVIAVLISSPKAMEYMTDAKVQRAALKSLVEVMPLTIEGLNSSLSWEFSETPAGNSGEMFETAIKAARARSVPVFTWSEKYGMAITRFWTEYGRQLILDPDLGIPAIVTSEKYRTAEDASASILPDDQSFTVLFLEPDETMTRVTNSWLVTNMMPKTGGEITGKREIAGAGEVPTVSIEFTGLTMIGDTVTKMALDYLASLKLDKLRPLELKSFIKPGENGITTDDVAAVDAAASDNGQAGNSYAAAINNAVAGK